MFQAQQHTATVHGWPALLILLAIVIIFVVGVVVVVRFMVRKGRQHL